MKSDNTVKSPVTIPTTTIKSLSTCITIKEVAALILIKYNPIDFIK